jgi:hypothetical protein
MEITMYSIKPMNFTNGEEYINITGNKLKTKFSIHESKSGCYSVTSAKGNYELTSFLDTLDCLSNKTEKSDGYFWWDLYSTKIITVLNALMRKFEYLDLHEY